MTQRGLRETRNQGLSGKTRFQKLEFLKFQPNFVLRLLSR